MLGGNVRALANTLRTHRLLLGVAWVAATLLSLTTWHLLVERQIPAEAELLIFPTALEIAPQELTKVVAELWDLGGVPTQAAEELGLTRLEAQPLTVDMVGGTSMVRILAFHTDPSIAARLAHAAGRALMEDLNAYRPAIGAFAMQLEASVATGRSSLSAVPTVASGLVGALVVGLLSGFASRKSFSDRSRQRVARPGGIFDWGGYTFRTESESTQAPLGSADGDTQDEARSDREESPRNLSNDVPVGSEANLRTDVNPRSQPSMKDPAEAPSQFTVTVHSGSRREVLFVVEADPDHRFEVVELTRASAGPLVPDRLRELSLGRYRTWASAMLKLEAARQARMMSRDLSNQWYFVRDTVSGRVLWVASVSPRGIEVTDLRSGTASDVADQAAMRA